MMMMMASEANNQRGGLVVISGPSGVGKTTLVASVRDAMDAHFSVSATTRPRSEQEVEGVDYFFLTDDAFQQMIERGEFLEHAQVFGRHWYGTPREPVEVALAQGRLVLLDIDVQGALQVRRNMPETFMIFILPPSEEVLVTRLRNRGRDDAESIERRLATANQEIALAQSSGTYDAFVINDDLKRAKDEICSLIRRIRV